MIGIGELAVPKVVLAALVNVEKVEKWIFGSEGLEAGHNLPVMRMAGAVDVSGVALGDQGMTGGA